MTSKIDFEKNWCYDMSYIMDSGQNGLYTTFPNFISLKSADPADLSKIKNCHILEKIAIF